MLNRKYEGIVTIISIGFNILMSAIISTSFKDGFEFDWYFFLLFAVVLTFVSNAIKNYFYGREFQVYLSTVKASDSQASRIVGVIFAIFFYLFFLYIGFFGE
ncbi:Uncharacterised protein [Psychrobacter phenylpyruvicus]|uniref:Uncharacterized protein n=1 Tax=Psychrobacter phenylpyruvicus TaxID=29432 RepID=A0A379LK96_9GAMM|nr:Uncharacterised protein [Psychrobacter phenylpyruvicus]